LTKNLTLLASLVMIVLSPSAQADPALAGELAASTPPMLSRERWQAKAPLSGMKPQRPVSIIVHHTGVAQNAKIDLPTKMRNLQSFSQHPGQVSPKRTKPAWPDVPYHFYIDMTGKIAEGRDVGFAGDTNTGYNTVGHIQVVVEGDFEREKPAPAQLAALKNVLVWLALSWNIPIGKISTHKDHAQTTCPGRNLLSLLPELFSAAGDQRRKFVSDRCATKPGGEFARLYCTPG
jgi:hypothetical protein